MKILGRLQSWVVNYWQSLAYMLSLVLFPLIVLTFRLTSLTKDTLFMREATELAGAANKQVIFNNPLQILFKLPEYLLKIVKFNHLWTVRFVPVICGLIIVLSLYYVVKQWYGAKTALATLVMTSTSSWLLGYSRLATPDIVYPTLIAVGLAYGAWLRKTKHSGLTMLMGVLLGLGFVYTSGLIWIAILAIFWQRKVIARRIAEAPKLTMTILIVVGVGIAPLAWAIARQPALITNTAGFASDPLQGFSESGIKSVDIIQQLAVEGQKNATYGLVNVAILDIFTYVMAILGLLTLFSYRKLDRSKVLPALLVLIWFLASIGGPVPVVALLPIIYLLAAAGIGRMLSDWLSVFPRNPLARGIGLAVLATTVVFSSYYHLSKYFVAWPNSPATKQLVKESRNLTDFKNLLK